MDGDTGEPGLLDEFFEEIRFSLELGDTTSVDMDIDEDELEDEEIDENLSIDESVVIASGGMLDELFDQIQLELEMHTFTSSSDDDEDESRSLLSDIQIYPATEIVAVSTRYFNVDKAYLDVENVSSITAAMVDNDESIENLIKISPEIPFLVEPEITGQLTSDEDLTCVLDLKKSWPSELQKIICTSSEEKLQPTNAEEETITGSDSMETVSQPKPKKRESFLLALGRILLNVGRKYCCCSGSGGRERRATNALSE